MLCAAAPRDGETARAALADIDHQIAAAQRAGDKEAEAAARWKKMVTLKNYSQTSEQAAQADVQMSWFKQNNLWDYYYRTWQLKTNALCALGKLQLSLQETQQMLNDAKERDSKLGHALAYKQIGIIYLNMKQTGPAVEALQRYAELMKEEDDDVSSLSNIYYRMAKAYDYDQNFSQELYMTDEWLVFLRGYDGKVGIDTLYEGYNACYLQRAAAFMGMERLGEAARALDTARHYARSINTGLSLHHYYKMQARYQLAKGDAAKALLYTDSVDMATNEKDDHTAEVRAQALMLLGRGVEAAAIYQRLYHEKDSVFGRDARQHLDELNTLFQVDELKSEQQRTKFRYTLITAFSVMAALLVLLLFGWRSAIRQKRANEQLRLANERAMVSSKMKTEFIRNISHEIRTPLNIVTGFTQIMTEQGNELSDAEKADAQRRITENTERITKLVDHMLELSDINSEVVIECADEVSMADMVAHALDLSGIKAHTLPLNTDAAVTFAVDGSGTADGITVRTNRLYAVRALAHLLENALKFTSEGSITLRTKSTDSNAIFIVEDTGIGIPKGQAEHVFDEFWQLDQFTNGTGIGLTVARSLARRMGGNLWLDTTYTNGCRFVLELPRTPHHPSH
mgnify:CR=1 FL=1